MGKELTFQCRRHERCKFDPWVRKMHWRRKWQPTPVFLPGKLHGQRSLEVYSPRGHKESDTSERLSIHTTGYYQILNIISLCYAVGSYCLLYIQRVSANPKFLIYPAPFHFGNLRFVLYVYRSLSVLQVHLRHILDSTQK